MTKQKLKQLLDKCDEESLKILRRRLEDMIRKSDPLLKEVLITVILTGGIKSEDIINKS